MARPLTRAQALQNAAFLRLLRRDGNARAAARAVSAAFSTLMHRRGAHPAFAQRWDAAVASAQARLNDRGGVRGPEARGPEARAAVACASGAGASEPPANAHRTAGGEPTIVRTRDGRIQVRAAHPDKLTAQCEQAFLTALAATANVRLSAAAAGASGAAFYRRRRDVAGFAREWGQALEQGYARIEAALVQSWSEDGHEAGAWAHNDPPPVPPMSANQALQLLHLHQKEARGRADPPHIKRRGESADAHSVRLSAMHAARMQRDREAFDRAEAARRARGERGYLDDGSLGPNEPPSPVLPDLAQVTGWSKADLSKVLHDADVAMFGGWRIGDMRGKIGEEEG